jgi:hypothetical protein
MRPYLLNLVARRRRIAPNNAFNDLGEQKMWPFSEKPLTAKLTPDDNGGFTSDNKHITVTKNADGTETVTYDAGAHMAETGHAVTRRPISFHSQMTPNMEIGRHAPETIGPDYEEKHPNVDPIDATNIQQPNPVNTFGVVNTTASMRQASTETENENSEAPVPDAQGDTL